MKKLLLFFAFISTASATNLEEVVVTAQRKVQNIQDVPVSVSVLTAEDLDSRQIDVVKQLLTNSPNLLGNNNLAQASALSVFIRGVGTTENLATAETSVGVYVDGVYVARQGFNNLSLHDVESVEVIRGPQGVMYGRNTNGGAIKINLTKPIFEDNAYSGSFYAGYGEANYKYSGGVLNVTLTDAVAIRANVSGYDYDGFVFAPNLNKDVNGGDGFSGRFAARYFVDNLDVNLSVDYSNVNVNGNFQTDIGGVLNPKAETLFETLSTIDAYNDNVTYGASLNVKYGDADSFELTSTTGYRKLDQKLFSDASGQPVSLYTFFQDQVSDQLSQEFQVVGKLTNNVSYVGGVYYFNEKADVILSDYLRTSPTASQLVLNKAFNVDITNYAAYGQLEYTIGKLTLAAGARYTSEERKLDMVQISNNPAPLFNYNTSSLVARGVDVNIKSSDTTPRFSASYKINDNATAYASYTEGFRAGGWTGRALRVDQYVNFSPEYVKTKEVGLKLIGDSWRLNTSAFTTDYEDLFNTLTINGAFTVQTADAKISGVEVEGNWLVSDWLSVYGSVGTLDSKYAGTKPANLADELQRSPKLQTRVGAKMEWNNLVWNLSAYSVDKYLLTPANLAVTAPALANKGIDYINAHTTVDSQWSWKLNNSYVTIGCVNCLDKEFAEGAVYIGQWAGAWAGDSRLWSLTYSYNF
ncbi:TonB-dependent receptor [bacterium]|nr:TonB-dependent receptor [bacterium]